MENKNKPPACAFRDKSGNKNPMFCKQQNTESRLKISASLKGQNTNKHWYNNGFNEIFCFEKERPEGYTPGRLSKSRKEELALNRAIQLLYKSK